MVNHGADAIAAFDAERPRLMAMAFRILDSRLDADDVVQEAWLRLARQGPEQVVNVPAWLTTVVGRLCIDVLRGRRARGEVAYQAGLADLVVTEDQGECEDSVERAEAIGLALLVILGSLAPDERLAFVLHDVFGVPFGDIATMLDKTPGAAKMAASRARRKVRAAPRPTGNLREQRAVVDAFLAAARDGDFEQLLRVLHPDVTWQVHTARSVKLRVGADEVIAAVRRGHRNGANARRVLVNGEPGIVAWGPNGVPAAVMACTVVSGRLVSLTSILDPQALSVLDIGPASG